MIVVDEKSIAKISIVVARSHSPSRTVGKMSVATFGRFCELRLANHGHGIAFSRSYSCLVCFESGQLGR